MVNKITSPITPLGEIDKINEIIDNLGGLIVDQTYNPSSANAQSGVAIADAGFIKANISSPVEGDVIAYTIEGGPPRWVNAHRYLKNTATGNGGLAINPDINGYYTSATGSGAIAIGGSTTASAASAIQIGWGTNNRANSLSVGFNDAQTNYRLLDGTTGLIPYQRINSITDNNAGGQLKTWTGTRSQYDAIVSKDANTLYNITDDDTYIGDIATDLNGKMDKDGLNCTCPMVVSRTPNNQGGVVEIWSDGYCIQTGITIGNGSWGVATITLDQSYVDTNYTISVSGYTISGDFSNSNSTSVRGASRGLYTNKTVSSFGVQSNNDVNWRTEGYIR